MVKTYDLHSKRECLDQNIENGRGEHFDWYGAEEILLKGQFYLSLITVIWKMPPRQGKNLLKDIRVSETILFDNTLRY